MASIPGRSVWRSVCRGFGRIRLRMNQALEVVESKQTGRQDEGRLVREVDSA